MILAYAYRGQRRCYVAPETTKSIDRKGLFLMKASRVIALESFGTVSCNPVPLSEKNAGSLDQMDQ